MGTPLKFQSLGPSLSYKPVSNSLCVFSTSSDITYKCAWRRIDVRRCPAVTYIWLFSFYWLLCWVMALLMSVRDKKPGKGQIYCRIAAFLNSDEKPSIDSTWLSYRNLQTCCCLKVRLWKISQDYSIIGRLIYSMFDLSRFMPYNRSLCFTVH